MQTTDRTNTQWLTDLQQGSSTRLHAISDLYAHLENGLYHYLSNARHDFADRPGTEIRFKAQNLAKDSLFKVLDNLNSFRGKSRFTTWAAKFAARAAASDSTCARTAQLQAETVRPMGHHVSFGQGVNLPVEHDELTWRIADWEDEGGRVLAEAF